MDLDIAIAGCRAFMVENVSGHKVRVGRRLRRVKKLCCGIVL